MTVVPGRISVITKWYVKYRLVGLGGLGVTCSPRNPRFAGANPTEVDGFFEDVKILAQILREGL